MPQDSIMDMVSNVEPLYNDKQALYRKWVREEKKWDEKNAHREARALAGHFAEAIESMPYVRGKYSKADMDEAADEMIEEFKTEELPLWEEGPGLGETRLQWCPGSGAGGRSVPSNSRLDRCPVCSAVFVKSGRMPLPLHKPGVGDVELYYNRGGHPKYSRRS